MADGANRVATARKLGGPAGPAPAAGCGLDSARPALALPLVFVLNGSVGLEIRSADVSQGELLRLKRFGGGGCFMGVVILRASREQRMKLLPLRPWSDAIDAWKAL